MLGTDLNSFRVSTYEQISVLHYFLYTPILALIPNLGLESRPWYWVKPKLWILDLGFEYWPWLWTLDFGYEFITLAWIHDLGLNPWPCLWIHDLGYESLTWLWTLDQCLCNSNVVSAWKRPIGERKQQDKMTTAQIFIPTTIINSNIVYTSLT